MFTLQARGKAKRYDTIGDELLRHKQDDLPLRQDMVEGPFVCKSSEIGLTCTVGRRKRVLISRARTRFY